MHRSIQHPNLTVCAAALAIAAALTFVLPAASSAAETTFSITGSGYGHGIGMSQYGAEGFAIQGKKYDWIMAHYFQGTTLTVVPELKVLVNLDADKARHASWTLRAGNAGGRLTINGLTVPADHRYRFVGSGTTMAVWDVDSTATVPYFSYLNTSVTPVRVTAIVGTGQDRIVQVCDASGPFGWTNVCYRGDLVLDSSASVIRLVNNLGIEGYIKGVVPRESPSSWRAEALKAQAVAARSYAHESSGELYCTTMSQVYGGYSRGDSGARTMLEVASTNSAVDLTANKVVTYGSTVVKTFFSSCAGGHTANVEDVWYTSTPKPYFKGVDSADAAGGSPNATSWGSPIVYTASGLGSTLRSHDSRHTWTPASSASVTGVVIERAASGSGFVRYVTVKWSDGSSYKIGGTTLQSVLGLKSSKFNVVMSLPPAPPVPPVTAGATRYEQTAPGITYSGAWRTASATSHSGGSYTYASVATATATVVFRGTGIVLVGPVYPHFGKSEVRLDGKVVATVNQYGPVPGFRQHLYEATGLASTVHTMTVSVTGTKDANSTGFCLGVDAFDVFGTLVVPAPPAPVWMRTEQNGTNVSRAGTWYTVVSSVHSGGSYAYAKSAGARMDLTFTGTGFKLIGPRCPNFGRLNVYVDGRYVATRSQYAARASYRQVIYSRTGLTSTGHRISVRWTGTKDAASHGTVVGVDAFDVLTTR